VSDFVVFWSCLIVYIGFYSVFGWKLIEK
jgi:hypothetical protein